MSASAAVFFDLDGTLTDPKDGILRCIRHAFAMLEAPCPDDTDLLSWIGPPLQASFAQALGADRAAAALRHYRERFAAKGMYENQLYQGMTDVLDRLNGLGYRLYIVTSKPVAFALPIARHFDIADSFRRVYGSELDGRLSDKGELIAHVLREEALEPTRVTMVGDRRHDIVGARSNGVRSVGVAWGYGTPEELAAADAVCNAVPELLSELGTSR